MATTNPDRIAQHSLNAAAEQVIITDRNNPIRYQSPQRRAVIGCIACQWKRNDGVAYVAEISKCSNAPSHATTYEHVTQLAETGAVEEVGIPNKIPLAIVPSTTTIGRTFEEAMQAPENCPLLQLFVVANSEQTQQAS